MRFDELLQFTSVRPVLDARLGPCDAAELPPPAASDSGYYVVDIPAQQASTTSLLWVHVGAAALDTSDFESGTVNPDASLVRGDQQVGWAVDLRLTSDVAQRISALADACQRTDPECPNSLGVGGQFIIAFGDAPISSPIAGADFAIPADRTLTPHGVERGRSVDAVAPDRFCGGDRREHRADEPKPWLVTEIPRRSLPCRRGHGHCCIRLGKCP